MIARSARQQRICFANGEVGLYEVEDEHYSEQHRCNVGYALVDGRRIFVRAIGPWTWQEMPEK